MLAWNNFKQVEKMHKIYLLIFVYYNKKRFIWNMDEIIVIVPSFTKL